MAPTETHSTDTNAAKAGLLDSFIQPLAKQPAYLLIFGLAVIFGFVGVGAGLSGAIARTPSTTYVGFGVALMAFVSAIIVVFRVTAQQLDGPSANPIPAPLPSTTTSSTANSEFDAAIERLRRNFAIATKIDYAPFQRIILDEFAVFQGNVEHWAQGEFEDKIKYDEALCQLYARAQSSVFCTSIPDHFSMWTTAVGAKILQSHKQSRASVTRVFIFASPTDVSDLAKGIMSKQDSEEKISIRVSYEQTGGPEVEDFMVIDDGDAVGHTIGLGGNQLRARWYFKNRSMKIQYLKKRDAFLDLSKPFKEAFP